MTKLRIKNIKNIAYFCLPQLVRQHIVGTFDPLHICSLIHIHRLQLYIVCTFILRTTEVDGYPFFPSCRQEKITVVKSLNVSLDFDGSRRLKAHIKGLSTQNGRTEGKMCKTSYIY